MFYSTKVPESGSLSYVNVLKPLIDLDYVSQTKNSWMQVSIFEMQNGNKCHLGGECFIFFHALIFFRFFWTTALIQSHNFFGQFLSKVAVDADIR